MLAVTRKALIKQPFSNFVFNNDQYLFYLNLQNLRTYKRIAKFGIRISRNKSEWFWATVESRPIMDSSGNLFQCYLIVSDASERKSHEDQLKQAVAVI